MSKIKFPVYLLIFSFFTTPIPPYNRAEAASKKIDQKWIDEAMKDRLIEFKGIGRNQTWSEKRSIKALLLLTILANQDPKTKDSKGKLASERAVEHIENFLSPKKDPPAMGGLAGAAHNNVAQSLLIAKYTPVIWNKLGKEYKERADWLMKGFAIAANWSFNDPNDFLTGLDQAGAFKKTSNPNFRNGYGAVIIACALYFDLKKPENLNKLFTDFSYDEYMDKFKELGLEHTAEAWEKSGKELMEGKKAKKGKKSEEVKDEFGGKGVGVKQPYVYLGVPLSNLFGIFKKLAEFTFDKKVTNMSELAEQTNKKEGGHVLSGSSPVLGKFGMLREFQSRDSGGERSQAHYAYAGWTNILSTMISLRLFGYWDNSKETKKLEAAMQVGTADLFFKYEKGYRGYAKGEPANGDAIETGEKNHKEEGYFFEVDMWNKFIKGNALVPSTVSAGKAYYKGGSSGADESKEDEKGSKKDETEEKDTKDKKSKATNKEEKKEKAWKAEVIYQKGDKVSYDDANYTCIETHKSKKGWEPNLSGINPFWKKG